MKYHREGAMRKCVNNDKGFTILEMLTVVGIIAILAAISTPAFLQWLSESKLRGEASMLSSAMQLGRLQAVKERANVVLQFNEADGEKGYTVFVDFNGNNAKEADEDIVKSHEMYPAVSLSPTSTIVFNSRGMVETGAGDYVLTKGSKSKTVTLSLAGFSKVASD